MMWLSSTPAGGGRCRPGGRRGTPRSWSRSPGSPSGRPACWRWGRLARCASCRPGCAATGVCNSGSVGNMASMHALRVHDEHSHVTDRPSRPCMQKLTWQVLSDHLMKAVSCSDAHMGDACVTCNTYMAAAARPACALLPLLLAASHHSCKPCAGALAVCPHHHTGLCCMPHVGFSHTPKKTPVKQHCGQLCKGGPDVDEACGGVLPAWRRAAPG